MYGYKLASTKPVNELEFRGIKNHLLYTTILRCPLRNYPLNNSNTTTHLLQIEATKIVNQYIKLTKKF